MIRARDFSHLRGTLVGISDRALDQHLALYTRAVERLQAIEAQYPLVDWGTAEAAETDAGTRSLLDAPVASLDLAPIDPLAQCLRTVEGEAAGVGMGGLWAPYLGDGDFWTSDRGRAVNVPWYLANPTLWRLAARQTETAYTVDQVLRCLRHELGHVVNYAHELWMDPRWRAAFGDFEKPYPLIYSTHEKEDHVEYLKAVTPHYAQKHPDEDWAETFACWLDPQSGWRQEYSAWPKALEKLELCGTLIGERVGRAPVNRYVGRPVPYRALRGTVRQRLGSPPGTPQFSPFGWSEHAELLRQEPPAYNAVVLHESYFGALGPVCEPVPEPLRAAAEPWGSWDSFLLDLRAAGGCGAGWALVVWDPAFGRMRIAMLDSDAGAPAGCPVLAALDLHEHAYQADYGNRRDLYLAAVLANLSWPVVAGRLALAAGPAVASITVGVSPLLTDGIPTSSATIAGPGGPLSEPPEDAKMAEPSE